MVPYAMSYICVTLYRFSMVALLKYNYFQVQYWAMGQHLDAVDVQEESLLKERPERQEEDPLHWRGRPEQELSEGLAAVLDWEPGGLVLHHKSSAGQASIIIIRHPLYF